MKVEVVKSSTSERDYAGLLDYFAAIDDSLARRFMKAVDDTVEMVAEFPELGFPWESKRPRLRNLRIRTVKDFENYLIVYRYIHSTELLLHIHDGRRDIEAILGGSEP